MNTEHDIRQEAEKAKAWRKAQGLTLAHLAYLSGYSVSAIVWFERGVTPKGSPTDPYAWTRYKRIAHSVHMDRAAETEKSSSLSMFAHFDW